MALLVICTPASARSVSEQRGYEQKTITTNRKIAVEKFSKVMASEGSWHAESGGEP
ncbi:hypothetical protein [Bosea sp. (in: a-proteobacteria)]|uniref:hypothetical protein n=1 Tax=Bosea sp. (in: a-proteobacteria) TaxID=1871050 RepID=UPI003F6F4015